MKLSELAERTAARVDGDGHIEIESAAALDQAGQGQVTFLANPRYTPQVKTTKASAIYVADEVDVGRNDIVVLRTSNPYLAYTRALILFNPQPSLTPHVHPSPVIEHNNSVIGCDGFGYAKDEERHWLKIPQTGRVVIEDDVEIGAGTTIDRASVGESRIARGTKIDNLVQVGHSCTVGEDTLLCAQVGLAGSSHVGSRVILAGQAGVAGHLTIGDDVVLTAKSATSHDVPAGKVISGIPAFDNRDWLRSTAAFRRLGDMQRRIRELEKKLLKLESGSTE